jgi:hypothetical protein
MDTKFGKLISRDREGTLTEVYPEILIDDEVNFADRRSRHPVTNIGVANAIDDAINTAKDKIKEAFSSSNGGLGWDESIQKGYVDFSQMPNSEIENIVNSIVDPDGAIVADETTGKLTVDFSKLTVEQIMNLCAEGGGISANASTRKLYVDFSSMDPSIMRNIVLSMVQQGGGLTVDQNGQLYVDFGTMPDDKFNKLKDSLDMQRTLSYNMNVFVDYDNDNASDSYKDSNGVIDIRRGFEEKPFKTISGAISYITKIYALGNNSVTITVKARSNPNGKNYPYYSEYLTLPKYTTTTGSITIQAYDYNNPPKVRNNNIYGLNLINCTGGVWDVIRLEFYSETRDGANGIANFIAAIVASNNASLTLHGIKLSQKFVGKLDRSGTITIPNLTSKPSSVYIGSTLVFGQNGFLDWPANPERPIISDANGTTTFVSASYIAPTETSSGHLDIRYTFSPANGTTTASYPISVDETSAGNLNINYNSLSNPSWYDLRMLNSWTGATLTVRPMSGYQTELEYDKGNGSMLTVLWLENQGVMNFPSSNIEDIPNATTETSIYSIVCSGISTNFAVLLNQSLIAMTGGSNYFFHCYYKPTSLSQSPTGKRFEINTGSGCNAPHPLSGVAGEGFPGAIEGTVDTDTFSWYRELTS